MDIQVYQDMLIHGAIIIPLVTGLVEVIKNTAIIPNRFLALVAVCLGGIIGVGIIGLTIPGLLAGLTFGLASTGVYEVGKNALNS